MHAKIGPKERAFEIVNGKPVRYLNPGHHWFWLCGHVEILRFNIETLEAKLSADQLALMPPEDVLLLDLAPHQRAALIERSRPTSCLLRRAR